LHTRHIERIVEHKGLIGIGLYADAVCGEGVEKNVDAIEKVINILGRARGVRHVALGSDFDGGVTTHFDASGMVLVTQDLLFRGFTEQEIRKIMGENVRDFLLDHLP
jgi:membrane dipeptidase